MSGYPIQAIGSININDKLIKLRGNPPIKFR
ncbi:unnamed protein product, partial [marine sediment metagenome]